MFGVAANCVGCKVLISEILYNSSKQRICSECLQKEYDAVCANLSQIAASLQEATTNNKALELKVAEYDAVVEQIKNFVNLIKKE